MDTMLGNFWWWEHIADLISLVMAGSLFLLAVILWKWPPPKSTLRHVTAVSAVVASGVMFWHTAINRISPHPRVSLAIFVTLLAVTMLRHRANIVGKQMVGERRVNGER